MGKVAVTYVGVHDEVVIPALDDLCVKQGDTVEVDADVAGKAPHGDEPGSGLLAQTANWERAKQSRSGKE